MHLVTRAENVRPKERCNVSKDEVFQPWLQERKIEDVEYSEFQQIITPYERETLMFNV
jgi:hypothetical protein